MQYIFLSHDVDWRRQGPPIEHILERKDRFDSEIFTNTKPENLYRNIPEYMELEEKFGIRSTFFFRTLYEEGDVDDNEANKRIKEIAKNQKNFIEVDEAKVANEGDLISFDYKATVDGNSFEGNEGKNTQLEIGKDLFIQGFDKQLLKSKKGDEISVEVTLPKNFPKKELVGKKGIFKCKINSVKKTKRDRGNR